MSHRRKPKRVVRHIADLLLVDNPEDYQVRPAGQTDLQRVFLTIPPSQRDAVYRVLQRGDTIVVFLRNGVMSDLRTYVDGDFSSEEEMYSSEAKWAADDMLADGFHRVKLS